MNELLTDLHSWECIFDYGGPCSRGEEREHDPWNTPKEYWDRMPFCRKVQQRTAKSRAKIITFLDNCVFVKGTMGRRETSGLTVYFIDSIQGDLASWLTEHDTPFLQDGQRLTLKLSDLHALDKRLTNLTVLDMEPDD